MYLRKLGITSRTSVERSLDKRYPTWCLSLESYLIYFLNASNKSTVIVYALDLQIRGAVMIDILRTPFIINVHGVLGIVMWDSYSCEWLP